MKHRIVKGELKMRGTESWAWKPAVAILAAVCLTALVPRQSLAREATALDSSFFFREAFLPPGIPSVALRNDETAMLWNPAGLAMSPRYHLGYAWKGTYRDGKRQVTTHFALAKAPGFALGMMRDDSSEGVKNTVLFSIAPKLVESFALGFTGKWKGGFNFDCGTVLRLKDRVFVGVVGRNLRDKKHVRRYWEGGIGARLIPKRLNVFFDVINEDSPWRKATAFGGGLAVALEYGISMSASYFTDGDKNEIVRTTLTVSLPRKFVEGEYSTATNDWQTLSARLSSYGQ